MDERTLNRARILQMAEALEEMNRKMERLLKMTEALYALAELDRG